MIFKKAHRTFWIWFGWSSTLRSWYIRLMVYLVRVYRGAEKQRKQYVLIHLSDMFVIPPITKECKYMNIINVIPMISKKCTLYIISEFPWFFVSTLLKNVSILGEVDNYLTVIAWWMGKKFCVWREDWPFIFRSILLRIQTGPESQVIGRSHKSHASGKIGKLYIVSQSGVSILATAVIAAIIGHSKFLITQPSHERFHVCRMNRWIAIWPMLRSTSTNFRGTGSDFPSKVQGSTCVTSLGVEFQAFSDRCRVDLVRVYWIGIMTFDITTG